MDIKDLRNEIDSIDRQLVKLFTDRMKIAEQVADYKRANNLPVLDAERERQLLNKVSDLAGEEFETYARVLFTTIMDLSKSYQNKKLYNASELVEEINKALDNTPKIFPERATVCCQGVEGAYSQKAADKIFTLPNITYVNTFENVFTAVENGMCRYGIVPLENSTAGSVNQTYDLLAKHDFYIVRSLRLQVNHVLLSKHGVKLSDVKEIFSHEQAINQCSEYLRSLKGVKVTVVANTAIASQMVANSDRKDVAAISSEECAKQYGLDILEKRLQNTESNFTKFICIAKNLEIYPGANRSSIVLSTTNTPGALYNVMSKFASLGINIIKLESRPIVGRSFEFTFYFDLDTPVYSDKFSQLIFELENKVAGFRYFGSYSEVI
ncbi:MAG: chorismate mutase [Clostridia bacterium]|nr:chorismate mutase [Clostridia bacterium]